MSAPQRLVPRAEDAHDGVTWRPLDDMAAHVVAFRPGMLAGDEYPIELHLGRDPSRRFLLSREESRRLGTVLLEADEVAGGAA